jgi:hypothetical protein
MGVSDEREAWLGICFCRVKFAIALISTPRPIATK